MPAPIQMLTTEKIIAAGAGRGYSHDIGPIKTYEDVPLYGPSLSWVIAFLQHGSHFLQR